MTLRRGSCSRISPDSVEGAPQVAAGPTAELLPSVSRLVAGEPQIEHRFDGRRGRPFAAPRAHSSSGGAGTGPMSPWGSVVKISKRTGFAYTSAECRHWVRSTANRSQVPQLYSPLGDGHEFGHERVDVHLGQEDHPRQGVAEQPTDDVALLRSNQTQARSRVVKSTTLVSRSSCSIRIKARSPALRRRSRSAREASSSFGGRRGMVQQLAERHYVISRSHDIHSTVEL